MKMPEKKNCMDFLITNADPLSNRESFRAGYNKAIEECQRNFDEWLKSIEWPEEKPLYSRNEKDGLYHHSDSGGPLYTLKDNAVWNECLRACKRAVLGGD